MSEPLLELDDVTIQYETTEGWLTAASDASFAFEPGEYFGLVGESGCGKSTIAQALVGSMDSNARIESGTIRYKGTEIQDMTDEELNEEIRWKEISYIPQSSMNSLDPLQRLSEQAVEIARTHTDLGKEEALDRFREMFQVVGIHESRISDYPHEFSGGMQQRAIIALALFLRPSLIIADEPTTALDVIMQDQIFKHLDEIKEEGNTGMMLITHDISLVFESCEKIAVMHSGQIAESGGVEDVFDNPRHPYSILLQEAFPDIRYPNQKLGVIEGVPPQLMGEVNTCSFADRCPWAIEECHETAPPLETVDGDPDANDHRAACIRQDEVLDLYRADESQGTRTRSMGGSR
jgi:oligopeptide/dipeptide ABC transporter ATP-binding protein